MRQKMGYILIAVGVALVVWGVLVVAKPKGEVGGEPVVEVTMEKVPEVAKVEEVIVDEVADEAEEEGMDSYSKGLAFEEFVVQRFNRKYFTLKELQKPIVTFDDLKVYRRRYPKANLFWDAEKGRLE